jgi:hypothetical protein
MSRIARDAYVPDEGASCEGDVGELVEHCLGALKAEEDLVEPGTLNFETHLATGPEERKSVVGRGDGALASDSVSSPSYTD